MVTRRSLLKKMALIATYGTASIMGMNACSNSHHNSNTSAHSHTLNHYDDTGKGPAILCSHGFMMDRTMFAPQSQELSQEYRVITYDSRARTPDWQGPYDLYDLVEECCRLLDHLNIQRCVLIGMSMGGWMALRFALKYSERLDGLVLIDSSAGVDDQARRNEFGNRFEALRGHAKLPVDYVDWIAEQMFGQWSKENHPELLEHWRQKFLNLNGDAVYHEAESWLNRDDLTQKVAAIQLPTLILHGAQDSAEPVAEAQSMVDAIPNAELVLIENAGHTSNVEQPQATNDAIRKFLDRIYGK